MVIGDRRISGISLTIHRYYKNISQKCGVSKFSVKYMFETIKLLNQLNY